MSKPTVTAAALRSFFNADPKRLASLSDNARKTVQFDSEGRAPKGRIHAEAVKVHNQRRKVQYLTGATKEAVEVAKGEAKSARETAAKAGVPVGKRGPLSKAAKATLSVPKV